jgi:hypothetical protein
LQLFDRAFSSRSRHASPQFVEEVQEEYHTIVMFVGRVGWYERDNALAVRRQILAR